MATSKRSTTRKTRDDAPQGAKAKIMESHTDDGLDAARTERVVDTSVRVADVEDRD